MTDQHVALDATAARLAAAAGVVMESLGLAAAEAFDWLTDTSALTGIPSVDLADLVVRAAARDRSPSPRRARVRAVVGADLERIDVVHWCGPDGCR